jgi:SAM-dependent methyltransferase
MTVHCPACNSETVEHIFLQYKGTCVTSDHKIAENVEIDNCICTDCGLIFNAFGTRLDPDSFYKKSYTLMTQNQDSKVQSFVGGVGRSQALISYELFKEMVPMKKGGSILEAGAGKGEFLSYFIEENPDWAVSAFEPSQSFEFLQGALKGASLANCGYEEFTNESGEGYDAIVSLGVLEHVNDPLDMLRWFNANLSVGGHCFIRVPNFKNNPLDLFCADHLSKLTVETITSYANASGFEVVAVQEKGVPMYVCMKKVSANFGAIENVYDSNVQLAKNNGALAQKNIEAIIAAREAAHAKNGTLAVFGMGSAGMFAPFYGGFPPTDIAAFIDENKSIWGNQVLGRPVHGLDGLVEHSITDIALSVSPAYREQIIAKLSPYGVTVH